MSEIEVKFHGKRLDNGEWVVGDLLTNANNQGKDCVAIKDTPYNINNGICNLIPDVVDPESVGQFITKDDYKNDIFEGSIIRDENAGGKVRIFVANDIRTFEREYCKAEHSSKWEVIGNLIDNSELLEKRK